MRGSWRGAAWPEMSSLLREGVAASQPDRVLLDRFLSSRDRAGELAFTILMARHGPMVLGVCRRILGDPTQADDAFQATFLVLARKAPSVRVRDSLGPWLRGVSIKVARRIQSGASRHLGRSAGPECLDSLADRSRNNQVDLERKIDVAAALDGLPESFGAALRMCYLEGLSHEEAAARLGCPVGTVRSRLSRGRELLRRRLEATPVLAPSLLHSTADAAARLAAGHSPAGVVPARVNEVATGVIATMFRTRIVAAFVIALGSLAGWGALVAARPDPAQEKPREIDRPPASLLRGDFDKPAIPLQKRRESGKPADEPADDFPSYVVETIPRLGDRDVDPDAVKEIRVTFSKPMLDRSWSWTKGNIYSFPESAGEVHYLPDRKTCVMPVKLEPGKTYVIGINGGRFEGFRDAGGRTALPSTIAFRTRAAK